MRRTGPGKSTAAILSLASICLLLASPQELTLLKGLLSVWAEKTPETGCVMLNVRSQDNDFDWHVDHGLCWLGPLCYPPLVVLLVLTFKDWSVTFHSSLGFWLLWHVKMEDCVTSPCALQQEEQTWEAQFLMTLTNKVGMRKLSALLCGLSIYKFSSILCKFLLRQPVALKAPYFGEKFSFKTTILHLELLGWLKLKISLKWPLYTAGGNKKWRSCCRNQCSSYSLNVCKQGYRVINSIWK